MKIPYNWIGVGKGVTAFVADNDVGDIAEINKANKWVLLKEGPNYSSNTKLRHLLRHKRLHEASQRNEISSCLLSEGLEHT